MSFGLPQRLALFLKTNSNLVKEKINLRPLFYGNVSLLTIHMLYALGTSRVEEIQVEKKYSYVDNAFSKFMIKDIHNRHYCVNNSFWYWKWDCIEDWNRIEKGDRINAVVYGWRIPILSIFPNVVSTQIWKNHSNIQTLHI